MELLKFIYFTKLIIRNFAWYSVAVVNVVDACLNVTNFVWLESKI